MIIYIQTLFFCILLCKFKVWWSWCFYNRHKIFYLICNLLSMFQCFRNVGKQSCHFVWRFYIKLMNRVTHSVWIIIEFIHPDTHKSFMILCIIRICIVCIVCCNNFNTCLTRNFKYLLIYIELVTNPVTHKFKIKIISKNILIFSCGI